VIHSHTEGVLIGAGDESKEGPGALRYAITAAVHIAALAAPFLKVLLPILVQVDFMGILL
jgi:hypothetical protein